MAGLRSKHQPFCFVWRYLINAGLRSKHQPFCFVWRYLINAGLWSKHQPFCFVWRYLIFLIFLLFFLERLGQRILQTARESRKISRDPQSGMREQCKFILSPKNWLPFPTFSGGVENTCSQFSRKLVNQFENCLRIMIKVLVFYKRCAAWTMVAKQLSLRFPGWKCINWKSRKETLKVYDTKMMGY